MVYTQKIQEAIRFSIKTHEVYQKQKRKGKDISYITHPLTVGLILSQAGVGEDLVIAGILHDTIEDSVESKKVNKEMLSERFGEKVAGLVDSVTEKDRGLSWHARKEVALKEIKKFSHESLLLKSADFISNNTELIHDYKNDGNKTFERFNASKDEALRHALQVIGLILNTWDENPLAKDLSDIAYNLQDIGALGFMENSPATMVEYNNYSSDMDLICPVCMWKGTPKGNTEYYDQLLDVDCPRCGKKIITVSYPLVKNDHKKSSGNTRKLLGLYNVKGALGGCDIVGVSEAVADDLRKKISKIQQEPVTCVLWKYPELVAEHNFQQLKNYVGESHFKRDLIKCTECGQLYFKEFVEEVDWVNGNDPQYRTYIPVESELVADELNKLNKVDFLKKLPYIKSDWPSDIERPNIYWQTD